MRLVDPAVAGRLIGEAVERVEATVGGPWWIVSPSHPARIDACERAALQARAKADAYARALGGRLGSLREIREPGTGRADEPVQHAAAYAPTVAAQGPEAAPPRIDVEPGEVDVFGAVEITFALEEE